MPRAVKFLTLFSALLLAVVWVGIFAVKTSERQNSFQSQQQRESQQPSLTNEEKLLQSEKKQYNLLLCGIDNTGRLADVIIYAKLDFTQGTAKLLQIPRDFYVGESYRSGKINEACLPFERDNPTKDIAAILKSQLGLKVDGAVAFTLAGVRAAVDSLGGVEMDILEDINYLPNQTIKKGVQTVNGEQAEWLLRNRSGYQMGDLQRLQVQKQFLFATAKKAKSLSNLELFNIALKVLPYLKSDIAFNEIKLLLGSAMNISSEKVEILTIPTYAESYKELSVLCANRFKLAEFLNQNQLTQEISPWSLNLYYPPQQQESEEVAEAPSDQIDFSWDFDDEDFNYNLIE